MARRHSIHAVVSMRPFATQQPESHVGKPGPTSARRGHPPCRCLRAQAPQPTSCVPQRDGGAPVLLSPASCAWTTLHRFSPPDAYVPEKYSIGPVTVRAMPDGLVRRPLGTSIEFARSRAFLTRYARRHPRDGNLYYWRPQGVPSRRVVFEDWARVRSYRSNHARTRAFGRCLHTDNLHLAHTSLGGRPPHA